MASYTFDSTKNTGWGLNAMRGAGVNVQAGGMGGAVEDGLAFFGFGGLTDAQGLKLNSITKLRLNVTVVDTPGPSMCLGVWAINGNWNDQEFNWDSIPVDRSAASYLSENLNDGQSPKWIELTGFGEDFIERIGRYGLCIYANANGTTPGVYRAQFCTEDFDTPGYAPQLTCDMEAVPLSITSMYPSSNAAYLAGETVRLSWSAGASEPAGGLVFGTARAQSYQVRYRKRGDSGYSTADVGAATSYSLSTGQWASGDTIEWQVVATATNGAVTESSWQTISLKAASISITDMFPNSSSSIYAGIGFTATWNATFSVPSGTSGSSYQAGAVVRVRAAGSADATEYHVSGSRESCAIPALGEGSWQWQVEVTDNHGTTKASSWQSFTAKALAIGATDLYPDADGRVPSQVANEFSWRVVISDDPEYENIRQQSAIFRWRQTGQSQTHEVNLGTQNRYTVPAGTFPGKSSIDWQVTVVANTGIQTTTDWVTVPTSDALSRPVCVAPVGTRVTDESGITFTWQNVIATNTPQQAWELSTSEDAGAHWVTQGTANDAATSYTLAAGTLTQPSIQWRVRTKNTDGEWGQYSQVATFILNRAAAAPSISATDSRPLTVIEWQSNEQEAYRVQIDDYDTGWVIATEGRYFHPYILADGPHTVKVQIMNSTGNASAEVSITIVTRNVPGETKPRLSLTEKDGYILLSWPAVTGQAYVVRDGEAIARADGSYIDYKTIGAHRYLVRVVHDRYYTDSDPLVGITKVCNALLGPLNTMDWVELAVRRGGFPGHTKDVSGQSEYRHYYGRRGAVKYTAGFVDTSHEIGYTLQDPAEIAKVESWVTGDVIYKDCRGRLAIGGLDEVSEDLYQRADLDFTITEFAFTEAVPYAES